MFSLLIRRTARKLFPEIFVNFLREQRLRRFKKSAAQMSTQQVFTKIYEKGIWGTSTDPDQPYYSGSGSHDAGITEIYVRHVSSFLKKFAEKPNVVDLGCGDFSVGSQLRPFCDRYVACDIVPPLIAHNSKRFASLNVDFRVVDLTRDELPDGDVVFIRQVLQHLPNAEIAQAMPRIVARYRYLVLTEHIPNKTDFKSNIDKPAGPDIRLERGSGLVLTDPPFSLAPLEISTLCEVSEFDGLVQTLVYRLR